MAVRIIIGVIALAGVSISGVFGAATLNDMVTRVNERLPPAQHHRFDPMGWWLPKTLRTRAEYRRLFPRGPLLRRQAVAGVAMVVCQLVVMACLGFFGG